MPCDPLSTLAACFVLRLQLYVLGEKGRSGLVRTHGKKFVRTIDSAFDKDITFPLAASIAGFAVEEDFDEMIMMYNTYENVAKFTVTVRSFPKIAGLRTSRACGTPAPAPGSDVLPRCLASLGSPR